MSKKLEEKQARRLAEERRKQEQRRQAIRRNLFTTGTAVLVALIVVGAIIAQRQSGVGAVADDVGVAPGEANCGEIETFEELEGDHVATDEPHAPYNSSPPTSGPMYESTAPLGFATEPFPPEQLVHNLEHGQVVIWYSPDAPAEIQDQLETIVRQEGNATIASPYSDLEAPYTFALTGWRNLQLCEKVSQEVVDDFRRKFQGEGPEGMGTPQFEG